MIGIKQLKNIFYNKRWCQYDMDDSLYTDIHTSIDQSINDVVLIIIAETEPFEIKLPSNFKSKMIYFSY